MFVVLTARDHGGAQVEAGQRPGRAHLPHLGQAGVESLVLVYHGLQISTMTENVKVEREKSSPEYEKDRREDV